MQKLIAVGGRGTSIPGQANVRYEKCNSEYRHIAISVLLAEKITHIKGRLLDQEFYKLFLGSR